MYKIRTFSSIEQLDKRTFYWVIFMHAGCLLAPFFFTWSALWVAVALYWVTGGFGICLGFHRLLAHRSFKTHKWMEYALTIMGVLAAQRSPLYWVSKHRLHHRESDKETDPHTPRSGFLWAHMWWPMADIRVKDEYELYGKDCPDMVNDPVHQWIQKNHEIIPLILAGLLFLVGGMPFLVWGFFVRTVLVYHATWLVNSATHRWGYRTYETPDDSRNNWWVALMTFGEGWHNNHHAFQMSAKSGMKPHEIDLTYMTICMLKAVGLAWDVKKAPVKTAVSVS